MNDSIVDTTRLSSKAFTKPSFLRELHRLFWTDPFYNEGVLDHGWHCREHAWAIALLCRSAALTETIIFHGSAYFFSPWRDGTERTIIWQRTHAWVGVPDRGFIDLSVRRTATIEGHSVDMRMEGVYLDLLLPQLRHSIRLCRQRADQQAALDAAQKDRRAGAVYVPGDTYDGLLPDIVVNAASWINSPLTDKLRQRGDPNTYYCAALMYLAHIATGGECIGSAQQDIWDDLVALRPMAIDDALRLARFG